MKDAQKPDHVSLKTIVKRLNEGRFVIPDFQRDFEWKPWDINALMRSLFRDYYIGSLLLWKGQPNNFDALACEPIYGYNGTGKNREHIVLDGQQRLTAMYYTFLAPDIALPSRKKRYLYFIRVDHFIKDSDESAFWYYWTKFGTKVLDDTDEQYKRHLFPLAVIGQGGWALYEWIQGYEAYWSNRREGLANGGESQASQVAARHADGAREFGKHVREITEDYQVSYIELDRELEVDKICDIFTQINSRGIQLDVFDLINALLKPKGLQLKHMWREAKPRLEFVDSKKMNVYILQVMSILRQSYCSPKYLYYLLPGQVKKIRDDKGTRTTILVADTTDFTERWDKAVSSLEAAIDLLKDPREYGAISSNYLPYVSILPVFAALQGYVSELPVEDRLAAQGKIRQWYWASVFVNRYSGSVESTSARDFIDIGRWIDDTEAEPALIEEFNLRFLGLELTKETKRSTSVYKGIFNLLIQKGAQDWMTGRVPKHNELDDHHIVPKSWGDTHFEQWNRDTILNRTPLTDETNRYVIGNDPPNRYLPRLMKKNGQEKVRAMMESHLISWKALEILMRSEFGIGDYEEFTEERERTIRAAIEEHLMRRRIDLPPDLKLLDNEIEVVEIGMRNRIESVLEGDVGRLPGHVASRVDERLQRAVKKNAVLDSEHYETLHGQLEFFDLRELQETIVNRQLWSAFEGVFGSKGTLERRFDQLAELRNGIRHSRFVDAVTRKEGEAAILWFRTLLRR